MPTTTLTDLRKNALTELDDLWSSVTTAVATDTSTLKDDKLQDFSSAWVKPDETWVVLPGGPTGAGAQEERRVASLGGNVLTASRPFSGTVQSGVPYDVTHVFKPSQVETALKEALPLCFPHLCDSALDSSLTVLANTYHYNVGGLGYYANEIFRVEIEVNATATGYPYETKYGWWVRPDGYLEFAPEELAGRVGKKIRLHGRKLLAFSGSPSAVPIAAPQTGLLQAKAIWWLANHMVASKPRKDIERWQALELAWAKNYDERASIFGMRPPTSVIAHR